MVVSLLDFYFEDYHIDYGDPRNQPLAARRGFIRTSSGTKSDAGTDRVRNRLYCLNRLSWLSVPVYGAPYA